MAPESDIIVLHGLIVSLVVLAGFAAGAIASLFGREDRSDGGRRP